MDTELVTLTFVDVLIITQLINLSSDHSTVQFPDVKLVVKYKLPL